MTRSIAARAKVNKPSTWSHVNCHVETALAVGIVVQAHTVGHDNKTVTFQFRNIEQRDQYISLYSREVHISGFKMRRDNYKVSLAYYENKRKELERAR